MNNSRRIWFGAGVLGIGALHFFVSFLVSFIAGIGSSPSMRILSHILLFPLGLLPASWSPPEPWPWLMWVFVSLCWGYGICAALRFLRSRKTELPAHRESENE